LTGLYIHQFSSVSGADILAMSAAHAASTPPESPERNEADGTYVDGIRQLKRSDSATKMPPPPPRMRPYDSRSGYGDRGRLSFRQGDGIASSITTSSSRNSSRNSSSNSSSNGSSSSGGGASVKHLVDRAKTVAAQICLMYHSQSCSQEACSVTGCMAAKRALEKCHRDAKDPRQREVNSDVNTVHVRMRCPKPNYFLIHT